MKVFQTIKDLLIGLDGAKSNVTIGNFDGVHVGHKQLLKNVKLKTTESNLKLVLITFVPHPRVILKGDSGFLINSYEERRELVEQCGVDFLVELKFDRDFSTTKPEVFVKDYLLSISGVQNIFLGHDFAFGADKSGSYDLVKKLASNKKVNVVLESEVISNEGVRFSSTDVRNSITKGKMNDVNLFLGRKFNLSGTVVKGQGRGRTIGFPTANILVESGRIIPKNGVYRTTTVINNMEYHSITNVGVNPTFEDNKKTIVETNVFDFDEIIYGENIKINFLDFIRPEMKFNSVNELIEQISSDVENTKKYFKR
ncbi:MAG: hypothetical protein CME61_04120 [Halobacteriovoraceae bacterium]|nr:hypothetical protein [Halobacteriovoraceae bacterium]